jgi:hypothetical protein
MSKSAKNRAKVERLKSKRSARSTNAAKYAAWAGTDKNKKRKQWSLFGTVKVAKHAHTEPNCGNHGCLKCSDVAAIGKIKMRFHTHGPYEAAKLQKRLLG